MTRAEPPSAARRTLAAFLLLFALIGLLSYLRADPSGSLSTDQINIGTIVLKEQHPEAMPRDFVYGDPQNYRFYTPGYRSVIHLFMAAGGSYEEAMRRIVPVMVFVFLCGMFLLIRAFTGSYWAAAATSLGAMTLRYSLAAEIWGVGSVRLVVPGSVYLSIAPLLVLLLWRWRSGPLAPVAFLILGFSANLHPISGMILIESFLLLVLIEGGFRPSAWRRAMFGAVGAAVGAAPFAIHYLSLTRTAMPADPAKILAGIDFRLANLFLFKKLAWMVRAAAGMSIPAALALIGWRSRRSVRDDSDRFAMRLLIAIAIVSIGGSLLIEAWMAATRRPPFLVDQLRGAKYLYLPLFLFCGYGFAALLRSRRWAIAAAFLLALQLSAPLHLPDKPDFGLDTMLTETRPPGRGEIPWLETSPPLPPGAAELAAWARTETDPAAVFHGGDELFRYRAARGITVTYKDGGFLFYANRPRFVEWYGRMLESEPARLRGDLARQEELARAYGADYLILRGAMARGGLSLGVAHENASYRVYDLRRNGP
jgi:hypothetical protein